ncbi:MAG: saccharopine dehydrogenase NADP-binding domain-containing protein, partial [Bacteroidota bacterium]
MKLTVIGAGAIGSAIVRTLCDQDEITQVQVCDASARSLQSLHESVPKTTKLRSFQVDVRDPNVIGPILSGSDCVIGAAAPELNPLLAETSIEVGSSFCDLGGSDAIVAEELDLGSRAREKNVWVVPNCGLAPGLVNILCMHGIEQFDEVGLGDD